MFVIVTAGFLSKELDRLYTYHPSVLSNMLLKLDMTKVYDQMSWSFIM